MNYEELKGIFNGLPVLVTGHTGFKGAWLTLWLTRLGANVTGLSLAKNPTEPCMFDLCGLKSKLGDRRGDIVDFSVVAAAFESCRPAAVFHLAAQAIVGEATRDPRRTFETNSLGTVNILEAIRLNPSVRAAVMVTTDKVYSHNAAGRFHKETDPLGSDEPYAASKVMAEFAIASYRSAFFSVPGTGSAAAKPPAVAAARAGNVIGGGDFNSGRLIPDCLQALAGHRTIQLRAPAHIRPWQHVLEPVSGYLQLAAAMLSGDRMLPASFNFAPRPDDCVPVQAVVDRIVSIYGQAAAAGSAPAELSSAKSAEQPLPYENPSLMLDASRAKAELGWIPVWRLDQALRQTVEWDQAYRRGEDLAAVTSGQIDRYIESAK